MFVIMPVKSHPLLRRVRVLPRKTKNGSWATLCRTSWPAGSRSTWVRKCCVGYNHRQPMSPTTVYKVTIQATPVGTDQWKVVGTGTWTPGQQPQLEQTLSAEVIEALFNVIPLENSGRNQVQLGDNLYAMVFRRISG
jgi:hypothetical protein